MEESDRLPLQGLREVCAEFRPSLQNSGQLYQQKQLQFFLQLSGDSLCLLVPAHCRINQGRDWSGQQTQVSSISGVIRKGVFRRKTDHGASHFSNYSSNHSDRATSHFAFVPHKVENKKITTFVLKLINFRVDVIKYHRTRARVSNKIAPFSFKQSREKKMKIEEFLGKTNQTLNSNKDQMSTKIKNYVQSK